IGLLYLLTEFDHIAIGLSLGFIAADDSDDILRVTLGYLRRALPLSLCAYRHGADHQNDNHRPHANTGPDNEVLTLVPDPRGLLRSKSRVEKAHRGARVPPRFPYFVVTSVVIHCPDPLRHDQENDDRARYLGLLFTWHPGLLFTWPQRPSSFFCRSRLPSSASLPCWCAARSAWAARPCVP